MKIYLVEATAPDCSSVVAVHGNFDRACAEARRECEERIKDVPGWICEQEVPPPGDRLFSLKYGSPKLMFYRVVVSEKEVVP